MSQEKLDLPTIPTVPSFQIEPTDNPNLFRVVDRDGDWTHYFNDKVSRYLVAVNHVLNIGFPKGQGLIEWLKKLTPEESERRLKSAGESGSKVHSAIRALIDGLGVTDKDIFQNEDKTFSPLSSDEWDCLMAFQAWAKVYQPEVIGHENALESLKWGYAGTRDFKGFITIPGGQKLSIDGKMVTWKETKRVKVNPLDWKTGGTYDDHKLQVASYNACDENEDFDYTGVVRLGTSHQNGGFEMKLWSKEATKYHFEQFIHALSLYSFLTGNKEWTPEVVQIPTQIEVKVPRVVVTTKVKKTVIKKGVKKHANNQRSNRVRKLDKKRGLK